MAQFIVGINGLTHHLAVVHPDTNDPSISDALTDSFLAGQLSEGTFIGAAGLTWQPTNSAGQVSLKSTASSGVNWLLRTFGYIDPRRL